MLVRLVTGCSWVTAQRLLGGAVSDTTMRARRDEWVAAGVFEDIEREALAGWDRVVGLDLAEVSVDGSMHKAPCGGDGTGKSPVGRGKLGWKWPLLCDRAGIPVAAAADGANRNSQALLAPTLADSERRGLLSDVETLHLGRGYGGDPVLKVCHSNASDPTATVACRRPSPSSGRRTGLVTAVP